METLAQDKPGHGAAVGGMCTHTSLHPLVPQVTSEDGLKGRVMDLSTRMILVVSIRYGYDAWSKGEGAERESSILWGHIRGLAWLQGNFLVACTMPIIIFAPCTEYMKLLKPMKLLQAEISHRKNNYSLPGMMGDGSFPSPQKPHAGSYRRFLSKYVPNSSVLIAALQSPAVALLLSPWSQQPLGPQLLPPLLCPPPSGPEGS